MKKVPLVSLVIILMLILTFIPMSAVASTPTVKHYGDVSLSNWGSGNFADVWDLTQCDLTLSYTIDMSAIGSPGWSITEVGIREVGAPNLDPNDMGGFLLSRYADATANPVVANMNDYHVLMKHGWLYEAYDREGAFPGNTMTSTAPWAYTNYAFWFDRDGVDEWQAAYWNYTDGVTYNTAGVYEIVIQYNALDATTGIMYATINGESQGFYSDGYNSSAPPATMPVGRTFTGDMTQMQVFFGRGGGDGLVDISGITAEGCLYITDVDIDIKPGSCPNSINLKSKGVVPVALLTTDDFDAINVDPVTVLFAGASPLRWSDEDVDGDGDVDVIFHFKTQELALDENSTDATLTGETMVGAPIEGVDTVNIVPKGKN